MNSFEKVLLGIIAATPATVPVFVHSQQGLAVANASEILVASILAQFQSSTPAPAPAAAAPVSSN